MKNKTTVYLINGVSLMLIFGAWLISAQAQTVNLQLQSDYTNAGAAYSPSLAIGDVNNDGRPDLVATNRPAAGGDFIAVYLNNGAGGFNSTPLPAGSNLAGARVVTLGDFNKDGNLDMVIGTDSLTAGLNIRLGNGTGNFATGTPTGSAIIESVSDLVNADFNGDGNLDLAMTKVGGYNTAPSNAVKVWLGNGNGGFNGFVTTALMFGGAQDLEVSDFNVDGRPDIAATAPNSNVIQVLINNGAGGFNAPVNTTSNGARKIASLDFNRDCIPDLAVGSTGINVLFIRLGNGAGGFSAPFGIALNHTAAAGLAVGDFNRDRKVDVAIRHINPDANNFTIRTGDGSGGSPADFNMSLPVSNEAATSLVVLDANLDGRSDIVINRQGGFALYHGNSTLFTRTENDYDGDLRTDLSVFRPSNGTWYVNRSINNTFTGQQFGIASDKLTPADFDGDGKTDVAVWRENVNGTFGVFYILNSSNNTVRIEQFGQTNDSPRVVGDWDNDGRADPAVYRAGATAGAQSFFYYRPSSQPGVNFVALPWGVSGDEALRGDFDGDGRQDAAVFRPSDLIWYIRQSSNNQTIYRRWGFASDKRISGDFDGDGKTDLAVFRPSDSVWYVLNSASGTPVYRQWGASSDSLTPGDYNGDGRTDTAVYRSSGQHWYVPQCSDFKLFGNKFGAAGDVAVPSAFVP